MAKQPDEQNIKSRARRRLIGAVALALGVVVILPMVLDSEQKISGKDIELSIPSADKAGEFVPAVAISAVVEAGVLADAAVTPPSDAAQASEVVPSEVVPPAIVPRASASGKITRMEANSAAEKLDARQAQIAVAETGYAKSVEKPLSSKKPVSEKITEPLSDKISATAPEKSVESSDASYIVQVAAFANAETAAQQAEQLKGWGFKAYTEIVNGTTRVRVGPYADRANAETVRTLLENHKLHPVIKISK